MYFKEESEMSVFCVCVWCVYECSCLCAIREVRDNFVESSLPTFTYKTNLGSCQPVWQTCSPFSSCVISLALCLGFWDSLSVSQTDYNSLHISGRSWIWDFCLPTAGITSVSHHAQPLIFTVTFIYLCVCRSQNRIWSQFLPLCDSLVPLPIKPFCWPH